MNNSVRSNVSFYRLAMLALVLIVAMVLSFAANGFSAQGGFKDGSSVSGGFSGPGPDLVTVEQAKKMSDDARVTLRGNIVQRLGDDEYVFRDKSGEIQVDIDRKRWQGQEVTPSDLVEIQGKVDRDWNGIEIDVKRLTKLGK